MILPQVHLRFYAYLGDAPPNTKSARRAPETTQAAAGPKCTSEAWGSTNKKNKYA